MPSSGRKCENCFSGDFPPKSEDLAERMNKSDVGNCRLNPPVVQVLPAQKGFQFYSPFPTVKRDEWCSHYSPEPGARH